MLRLKLKQARARNDEENDPANTRCDAQFRIKQFRAAEAEQDNGEKIRSRAHHHVGESRDDRTEWAYEILRGPVWRRNLAEPDPGRHVLGRVGDQREEKESAGAEQKESEDFIPRSILGSSGHCGSQ